MPRSSKKKSGFENLKNFDASKFISGNRSYMSLAYGVLTVVVIFIIVFLGIRAISDRNADVTEEAQQTQQETGRAYTVKEGDSLWTIAEEVYNDGYKWTVIAEANNLESPDAIETGMELVIPEVAVTVAMEEMPAEVSPTAVSVSPTAVPSLTPGMEKGAVVSGNSYTVVEGDNLWIIAVQAYGDGYRWVDIAKANSLVNPDVIHPGNVFTLPR